MHRTTPAPPRDTKRCSALPCPPCRYGGFVERLQHLRTDDRYQNSGLLGKLRRVRKILRRSSGQVDEDRFKNRDLFGYHSLSQGSGAEVVFAEAAFAGSGLPPAGDDWGELGGSSLLPAEPVR